MKVKAAGMGEKPSTSLEHLAVDETEADNQSGEAGLAEAPAEGETGNSEEDIGNSEGEKRNSMGDMGNNEEPASLFEAEVEEEEDTEAENSSSQASKPVPPPRSDSHTLAYKVSGGPRQMVDTLESLGEEEPFSWNHQREYLLTCMGFVNGLGCLLQFSTLTVKHGGGVFFVAYVACMVVMGCPLVYLETTLGQYANGGPVTAWKVIPLFQGLGYCMVCVTFLISTYYIVEVTWNTYYFGLGFCMVCVTFLISTYYIVEVTWAIYYFGLGFCMVCVTFLITTYYIVEVTWAIYYFGLAMVAALGDDRLPWDCTNRTDTHCSIPSKQLLPTPDLSTTELPRQLNVSIASLYQSGQPEHSAEMLGTMQYFYSVVLQLPPETGELGIPVWYLALCLLLAWLLVYACLIYGPISIGKVMYVTAPYPYVALSVLFVFLCMEKGSLQGIRFFLNPQWEKLAGIQIWRDAAQLMVYTLSLGTGCLHTLAGYTHFHSHCFRNLLLICMCNVMGTMLAGFTMCSGLGVLANVTNTSINQLSLTEYELGYAIFPYILSKLSNAPGLSMVYFSVIVVIGLDTLMVFIQSLVGALTDFLGDAGYQCNRTWRWMMQLVLCAVLFCVGLIFTTQGGLYVTCFMRHFFCYICQFVVVGLECGLLMYVFGARKFTHNIEDMTGNKDSPWWLWNWKVVSPCLLFAWLVSTLLFQEKLQYKGLLFSDWSEILGWCLSLAPLLCIPVCSGYMILHRHGTLAQRCKGLLATPRYWGAGLHHSREDDSMPPDYVICQPDNHRPMHGLAMLTANLYIPNLTTLNTEDVPQETGSEMTGGYLSDLMTITSTDSIESSGGGGGGDDDEEGRGNWRGKLEFVLSCLGYVLGLGNIWRFPFLVYRNGGGAFFIPYLIMLMFCGMPLVYLEMAFGQYASLGPVTIWRAVPIFKGVGYAMVVTVALIAIYYNMVIAWGFHFLFASFSASLPWATCDNSWNTKACSLNKFLVTNCSLINSTYVDLVETEATNSSDLPYCVPLLNNCIASSNQSHFYTQNVTDCIDWLRQMFGESIYLPERQKIVSTLKGPSEEYFYNEVLHQSAGLQDLGPVQWQLALFLLLCWFIVFMCLVRGIYSAGKVAYFVVIVPVVLLLILLVCAMMVEGHLEGIRFYVTPRWDRVLTLQVWGDAASQVIFSLSACGGGLTTLSSYNKFHNNVYRDAIIICIVDTLMSVLAGFTVFASMGILAVQLNTTVDNVVESSIGLVFVAFPAAVTNFEPSTLWSICFFLMIVMMGMSTMVVMTEIIVTVIIDENVKLLSKARIFVLLGTCCVLYLLGLPLTTRGGLYLLQLLDEFCGAIPNIIVGLFMCTAIAWVYKVGHFSTDIRMMIGTSVSWWWRLMWCCVTPIIIMFVLVLTVINSVKLDPARFPTWCQGFGTSLTVASVIAIPVVALKKLLSQQGSVLQRLKASCKSEDNWGPAQVKHWKHVEYYPAVNTHTLSVDIEQSPVHAITDHVNFTTSDVRLPHLSTASLLPVSNSSPKKPQELRQKAILNHAYSNPQCSMSNGSLDKLRPRLSLQELPQHPDMIMVTRKTSAVKTRDVATQTDARSYTLAIKQGSIRTVFKEMKIEESVEETKPNQVVTEVEITKF